MSHKCPISDCLKSINDAYLMCPEHWRQVPGALQDAVWKTWKPVKAMLDGKVDANEEKIQSYRAASRAVIEAVEGVCQQKTLTPK